MLRGSLGSVVSGSLTSDQSSDPDTYHRSTDFGTPGWTSDPDTPVGPQTHKPTTGPPIHVLDRTYDPVTLDRT